jgi:cytochrome c553
MKIIISVALTFFLLGCSDDGSASSAKQDIFKPATSPVEKVVSSAPETVEEIEKTTQEVAQPTVETEQEKSEVVAQEATKVEVVEEVKVESVVVAKSGADLYKVCSSCHGQNGEKKALNKSQVIQAWSEVQVSTALNGYKDGSYGGAMKGLMKSQVTKLSDEDISALSKYISEL